MRGNRKERGREGDKERRRKKERVGDRDSGETKKIERRVVPPGKVGTTGELCRPEFRALSRSTKEVREQENMIGRG